MTAKKLDLDLGDDGNDSGDVGDCDSDGDGDDEAEQILLYSYSVHHSCRIFDMEQTSSNHQIAKLHRWISEQRISGSFGGNHHHHHHQQ